MLSYIKDAGFLQSLYPDGLSLTNAIIDKLTFSYNGPAVEVSIHTSNVPVSPPPKWQMEFNQVKITLELFDIVEVTMDKWGRTNSCSISIDEAGNSLYKFSFEGSDCRGKFVSTGIYFKSISPYLASV